MLPCRVFRKHRQLHEGVHIVKGPDLREAFARPEVSREGTLEVHLRLKNIRGLEMHHIFDEINEVLARPYRKFKVVRKMTLKSLRVAGKVNWMDLRKRLSSKHTQMNGAMFCV